MAVRRRATFLLAAVALGAGIEVVPATSGAGSAEVQAVAVRARPIRTFKLGSAETRFGPLEFVGGLEMTSSSWNFGAMSALRFRDPGSDFMGVTDTGFWYFGRIERDAEGRPAGVADFTLQQMVDPAGKAIGEKWATDAEGLAVRDGLATVSFEREHRVSEFRIEPSGMTAVLRDVDFLVPAHELRMNRGLETVAYAPAGSALDGARVVISEKSLDRNGNIFAAVLEGPRKGVFSVARKGDFDVSDGAFLPDGDLLLLERSFSMAKGVAMRLRRIPSGSIGKGQLADGPILMEADMGYQIDNMEGIDVWRRDDGTTLLSLVSDDNHSILQRNLYLEFRLHEE